MANFVRQYTLMAHAGRSSNLAAALDNLGKAVRAAAGCSSVVILQDTKENRRLVLVETWASSDTYEAYKSHFPMELLGSVMSETSEKPVIMNLVCSPSAFDRQITVVK